jgi:hypothetical protein
VLTGLRLAPEAQLLSKGISEEEILVDFEAWRRPKTGMSAICPNGSFCDLLHLLPALLTKLAVTFAVPGLATLYSRIWR